MHKLSKCTTLTRTTVAVLFGLIATAFTPCSAQTIKTVFLQPITPATDRSTLEKSGTAAEPAPKPQQSPGTTLADRVKSFNRLGPTRDDWTTIDLGTKFVKGVFGGFEQGAGVGLGLQLTTADKMSAVELRATLLTSLKLYRRFEGEAYFPKVFSENTHVDVWFDYLRRTKDNFFGIGPRFPNFFQTNFDIERRSFNATLSHDFSSRAALGGYVSVVNSSTYRGERDTDIPIDFLFSGNPNVIPRSRWAPGLMINTSILSYGAFADYDGRDNSSGLTKGVYLYGRIGSADGLKNRNRFSDYGWLEAEMDARGYVPLGSDNTSLAVRAYTVLKDPKGGSQIPFYDLSFLGGRNYVRGFRGYRFRGNNVVIGSVELRQTIWRSQEDRGVDVFAFGDAGQVWGDNRSRTDPAILANQDFSSSNYRAGVGGGFQFRYNKSLAGRVEVGHSHERTLIYFSISRGF